MGRHFQQFLQCCCLNVVVWQNKWLFKVHPLFWGKWCKFGWKHEICILQSMVETFFRCGGQIRSHLSEISSGLYVPQSFKLDDFFKVHFTGRSVVYVTIIVTCFVLSRLLIYCGSYRQYTCIYSWMLSMPNLFIWFLWHLVNFTFNFLIVSFFLMDYFYS